uniref:Tail tube protein n=1 Tax=Vibrio phage Vc1 TaxID=1480731 RepID=A0A6M5CA30_9CAUD
MLTVAEGGTDFAKGDYIIVTAASWGKLIDRVLRVTASTETEVTVEGIDTSDTNVFPAGNVTATLQKSLAGLRSRAWEVTVEGIDTSDTNVFPAGNVTATLQKSLAGLRSRAWLTVAEGGTDFAKGDYIIVTAASWGKLIDRVLRVTASTETEVTVEGIDTSDTNVFPAGNVTATLQKSLAGLRSRGIINRGVAPFYFGVISNQF